MAGAAARAASAARRPGARVLIVEARFYADIADVLLAGAVAALERGRGRARARSTVPGALEIPTGHRGWRSRVGPASTATWRSAA